MDHGPVQRVEVGGVRIAYRRAGSGPPLLLVHGMPGDGRVWRDQLAALADEFTVIAWDAPGCGESTDPPEEFRLPEYADCLAGFAAALGVGPAHLLGHSFGGGLVLEVYRRHPELVRSLTLAGAYAGWAGSLPPMEVDQRLRVALHAADELATGEFMPQSIPGLFSNVLPPQWARELATILSESRPVGVRTGARAFAEADLREALPTVRVPVLLLYGDADVRAPRAVADQMQAALPASELVLLPGLGHLAFLESPAAFDGAVRRFLSSTA